MVKVSFGCEMPVFSGIGDAHPDAPCYERLNLPLTLRIASLLEELGFDRLWICDHLIFGNRGEVAECWTTLSAIAAITKRIRLGPMVLADGVRNPALLAKMASTLDNISGGRLDYGIGAGWHRVEQESYGLPWLEKPIERISRMEEGIEIVKKMWTEEEPSFEGKYYRIRNAICNPKPVQKPHPPIWIPGQGKRMLQTVARYADGWEWFSSTVEEHRNLICTIKKNCEKIGRNPNSILFSWHGSILIAKNNSDLKEKINYIRQLNPHYPLSFEQEIMQKYIYPFAQEMGVEAESATINFRARNLVGDPDEIIDRIQSYVDIGVSHFILSFLDYPSTEGLEMFTEKVIPAFR
jgi:probable F420-dependent oxidoreductase